MAVTLTELTLKNFKAFGDELQTLPMSNITLIYGPNSGGKSTVIQALLLLKQSDEDRRRAGVLVSRGDYVDLASFRAMVHKHEDRHIHIGIALQDDASGDGTHIAMNLGPDSDSIDLSVLNKVRYELYRHDVQQLSVALKRVDRPSAKGSPSPIDKHSTVISYEWENDASIESYSSFVCSEINNDINRTAETVLYQRRAIRDLLRQASEQYDVGQPGENAPNGAFDLAKMPEKEMLEFIRQIDIQSKSEAISPVLPSTAYLREPDYLHGTNWEHVFACKAKEGDDGIRFIDAVDYVAFPQEGLNIFASSFRNFVRGMSYLGSLLQDPSRYYAGWGGGQQSVGKRGEFAFDILAYDDAVRKSVNEWFEKFEIPYHVGTAQLNTPDSSSEELTGVLTTILLTDQRTGTNVTPVDVGFGISQILPVIVEGIAGRSNVICVDQPEVHLHPRLQAQIADLLIETRHQKQWIVETHSELLARRIQTRLAEGAIEPSEVSVLYVDPHPEGSQVEILDVDLDGTWLEDWPAGFFEDRQEEIRARHRAWS
jgi:predicted ATPase